MSQQNEMVGIIDDLLTKVAAQDGGNKQAEANTEAGGYQGSTTHPVKDVDDSTDDAQEGARSSENHSDVKADQGSPSVDSTSEGTPGGQDSVQMDVGITSKSTGEDKAVEEDYKPGKDDPGTSHPAKTDNDSLDGHKYSSDIQALQQLCKQSEEIGSQLLAAIATETNGETQNAATKLAAEQAKQRVDAADKEAGEKPVENTATGTGDTSGDTNQKEAEQTGYDLAGLFANTDIPMEDKQAADRMVVDTIDQVLQLADSRAEKCAEYYAGQAAAQKKAEEEGDGGEKDKSDFPEGSSDKEEGDDAAANEGSSEGGESSEGGDPIAEGAGAGGDGGEADILALLNGGESMGAEDAVGGMGPDAGGGDPLAAMGDPAAAAGGADPMAAAGGDPLAAAAAGGGDPMAAMGGGGGDPMAAMGGGGGDPMAAMGGGGGDPMAAAGGGDPMAAMGGGGDPMVAGGDPMAAGGDPMAAMGGGGDPMAAAGGDPMAGGMGGGMGGGMDDAAALEAALAQLGISLEDLQMAMAQKAASVLQTRIQRQVSGVKSAAPNKPKTAADQQRVQNMMGVVREIIGRGS